MIIYFSGTGNGLYVARQLAVKTADVAVPLIDLKENPDKYNLSEEDRIGIVSPVYFGNLPSPVQEFFAGVEFSPNAYIYGLVTCGGEPGVALYSLRKIIGSKGSELSYGQVCPMISNSTAVWKSRVNYKYEKLAKTDEVIAETAAAVLAGKQDTSAMGRSFAGRLLASDMLKNWGLPKFRTSVDGSKCTGCGICTRLCPNHSIRLEDGKAVIGRDCSYCTGCAHSCPTGAVIVNRHAIKRENQYHHPAVELEDRFLR